MQRILDLYADCLAYDIAVLSQWWVYWLFFVPALLYVAFMVIKWVLLTAPFWLPIVIVIRVFATSVVECYDSIARSRLPPRKRAEPAD